MRGSVAAKGVDAFFTPKALMPFYANGVTAYSPGLATAGSLPWVIVPILRSTPKGFQQLVDICGFNPFGVVRFFVALPRVGSLRSPTLGCWMQRRWRNEIACSISHGTQGRLPGVANPGHGL